MNQANVWHRHSETKSQCPICGAKVRKNVKHIELTSDEKERTGVKYLKIVKVCFGQDFTTERYEKGKWLDGGI